MKILIAYSSRTGNTRKVAEALHLELPGADLCPISSAPNPEKYDVVFAGFWVEAENANDAMKDYLKQLGGIPVALFATLGAYPDSQHAANCLKAAAAQIPNGNVVDRFICQGRIDPMMIEWMEQLPAGDENAPTDSRRQLWEDAEGHPDDQDLENAVAWAKAVLEKMKAKA
ncbi:flavodoxin family protein [Pontiella agarivorans]|uniref:Flavodoxin family protein n=1 Tax=Pontiella agarivorans TaxID=3038953 RepID=A0ABU5MVD1_9BACT|nr:flavodoxin family protein [Pontiella agarivorans]MDZ8117911.1 flavodoxin family protein [Pontiella agarivorans]